MIRRNLHEAYSPLYFLAALAAAGVAISFFVYLMFLVEHPHTPMVTFDQLWPMLATGAPLAGALVGLAMAAIAFFSLLHLRLLWWNLVEFWRFRRTQAYQALRQGNAEVTLMAVPLTLAMSVNLLFVNAVLFVPGLWSRVEYLLPLAILAFTAIGGLALRLYARYFTHVVGAGDFRFDDNNTLGQMVAVFAFTMVSVGLAAPGAMSHQVSTHAVGIVGAIFFAVIAVSLGLLRSVTGFKSMLRYGIAPAGGPSLWILIPILALLGIAIIRVQFGLAHGFGAPLSGPGLFVPAAAILSLQLLFGILGYSVMRRLGYFKDYLNGEQRHPGSYALVCPGVALFVFGMFFVNFGLVRNDLIVPFSWAYFVALAPLVFIQLKTVTTLWRLNTRLLQTPGPLPGTGYGAA